MTETVGRSSKAAANRMPSERPADRRAVGALRSPRTTEPAPPLASGLHCGVDRSAAIATVRLVGRLTGDNVRVLGARLAELIRSGHRYLVLEFGDLAEVAPVCVGVLNRTVAELQQVQGTLTVRGLERAALAPLVRAGLHPAVRYSD